MAMLPHGTERPGGLQSVECCPACGQGVDGERGLACHYGRHPACSARAPVPMEEDPQASAVQRDQAAVYEDSTREAVGNDFADWRFTKYIPSTTVDSFKTKVRGWLQKAADELVRRLDGRGAISRDDLRDVVCSVLDLFAGIETEKKEAAALRLQEHLLLSV